MLAPRRRSRVRCAAIGVLLEDHRVARLEQQLVDQVDALQRARGDQHVVGVGGDAAAARSLLGDELAQLAVALRPAVERCRSPGPALRAAARASRPRSAPRPGCPPRSLWPPTKLYSESRPSAARPAAGRGRRAARSRMRSSGAVIWGRSSGGGHVASPGIRPVSRSGIASTMPLRAGFGQRPCDDDQGRDGTAAETRGSPPAPGPGPSSPLHDLAEEFRNRTRRALPERDKSTRHLHGPPQPLHSTGEAA